MRARRRTRREADFKRPSETEFKKEKICQGPILARHWELVSRPNKAVGSLIRQSCLLPKLKISGPPKKD